MPFPERCDTKFLKVFRLQLQEDHARDVIDEELLNYFIVETQILHPHDDVLRRPLLNFLAGRVWYVSPLSVRQAGERRCSLCPLQHRFGLWKRLGLGRVLRKLEEVWADWPCDRVFIDVKVETSEACRFRSLCIVFGRGSSGDTFGTQLWSTMLAMCN